MPEGPEIRITCDGLNSHLKRCTIEDIQITPASRYYKSGIHNMDRLKLPLRVETVVPKGKKILIYCKDKKGTRIVLISALAMEGSWKLHSGKHSGIEIHTTDHRGDFKILYFHDTRHFGTFHICMTQEDMDYVLKDVGPDLLNDDVRYEDYHRVITQKKLQHKEICWFMMEQKFFSGVGNYLLSEILYACRILPTRKLQDLSDEDIYNLWNQSKRIIQNSYKYGGLTIATYFAMDGSRGTFRTKVYGQKYDPHGNRVLTGTFSNKRTSHYVPEIQN